jgi:hypothetical protein
MKRFFTYLVAVVLVVAAIDLVNRWAFGKVFDDLSRCGMDAKTKYSYAINEEQSDILILGASRAKFHYNAQQIIDSLGKTCYNAGHDGQPIYNAYLNLLRSAEIGPVETVILDLTPQMMGDDWVNNRYETLIPFYWKNDTAHAIVNDVVGPLSNLVYSSSLVQYNSKFDLVIDWLRAPSSSVPNHGYTPLAHKSFVPEPGKPSEYTLCEKGWKYVNRIVDFCKQRHIRLIISISPMIQSMSDFSELMANYCRQKDVDFVDYSTWIGYDDLTLWKDNGHLASKGADLFTAKLIQDKLKGLNER